MGTIQKHYNSELAKEKPNKLLLSILTKVLERKTLTSKEWRLSGRFIPKAEFLNDNPTAALLASCSEVIQYIGGDYIQVTNLSSGTFRYTSSIKGNVLDDVEDDMWNEIAEKLFCENC
jgi:hypothetical protein